MTTPTIHPHETTLEPTNTLAPHPENPRRGATAAIVDSIQAHGFYGALIAQRSTRYVIAGNHRLQAAITAGLETVPVIWLDVTDEQARRILTKNARQYRADALAAIQEQRPKRLGEARLKATLTLHPPTLAKRDLANFEKAPIDALVFAGVFTDDSQIDDLRIVRGEVDRPDGRVVVELEAIP